MKRIIILSAVVTMLYAISQVCGCGDSCGVNAQTLVLSKVEGTASVETIKGESKTVTLKITGMTCAGCANHVSKVLNKVNGVLDEEVRYPGNIAIITYDPDKTSEKEIIKAIEKTGYKASITEKQSEKSK